MPGAPRIIVLEGDQTGQELLDQALRLLDPAVSRVKLDFEHYDLSLENRRKTANEFGEVPLRLDEQQRPRLTEL